MFIEFPGRASGTRAPDDVTKLVIQKKVTIDLCVSAAVIYFSVGN